MSAQHPAPSRPQGVQKVRTPRSKRLLRLIGATFDPRAWAHFIKVMNYYNYSHVRELRKATLHPTVNIAPTAGFANAQNIEVGARTTISANCQIWAGPGTAKVVIGTDGLIAPDVMITATNYRFNDGAPIEAQAMDEATVTIGDDVWLARGVTVLPGVTVGQGAVVAAGAVVYNDVPPYAIIGGNPARVIGRRRLPGQDAAERSAVHGTAANEAANAAIRALILREISGLDAARMAGPISESGIDSFDLITLRVAVEAALGGSIPDGEWATVSRLEDIAALPAVIRAVPTASTPTLARPAPAPVSVTAPAVAFGSTSAPPQDTADKGPIDPPAPAPDIPRDRYTDIAHKLPPGMPASMVETREPGWLHRRHLVEMPKMALTGLGEPWLFRELGDLHWMLILDFLQTASSQVTDEAGDRLYATITRCKIDFTPSLFHFKENTPLDIRSRLERYGSSVFFSQNAFQGAPGMSGHATVMSTFAKYGERGKNTSLIKGSPTLPIPEAVPPMEKISDFGFEYRTRRAAPPPDTVLFECDYEILPPHDINGVGLLYSAAYPTIYDLCLERHEGKGFLMGHSTAGKDLFYFANSEPTETLLFRLHERTDLGGGLIRHVCTLSRKSDGQRMGEVISLKRRL